MASQSRFATIYNVTSTNYQMITTEDLSITGNLKVAGGNVTLPNIAVGGATIGANALAVAGNVAITGNTLLTGNLSMNGLTSSFVSGNVTIGSVATSTGNTLTVGGNVGITGNLFLKGGRLDVINGNLTLNGNIVGASSSGSITASNIAIGGATIGSNALAVSGNTTLDGRLTVTGTLTLPNSSVTNAMLSNNSITIAGTGVSLGGSISQATVCSGYATTANASHTGTTTFNGVTVINSSGRIGIGTTDPAVPLMVASTASYYSGGSASYGSSGSSTTGGGTRDTSIVSSGWVVAATYTTPSDTRIKKNIQGIDDNQALSLLRLIKPKTFQYIDQVNHGPAPVYGFIAQEVGEILPFTVNTMCNFIPNIFEEASVTNGNIITLTNVSTTSFVQDTYNNIVKIKAYDLSNNEILTNIIKIIDDKSFQVDVDIESPQLFVYGQEVSDFYSLEKETIFTITTAVVQQIDREFQEAKQTIQVQQSQIQDLQRQIGDLHTQLINVLDRLSTMDLQR
jgi:hypothetical protein